MKMPLWNYCMAMLFAVLFFMDPEAEARCVAQPEPECPLPSVATFSAELCRWQCIVVTAPSTHPAPVVGRTMKPRKVGATRATTGPRSSAEKTRKRNVSVKKDKRVIHHPSVTPAVTGPFGHATAPSTFTLPPAPHPKAKPGASKSKHKGYHSPVSNPGECGDPNAPDACL